MKLDTLLRSHSAFLPSRCRILTKTKTSINSASVKAVKLAAAILVEILKIWSYVDSVAVNRVDGGSAVKNKPARIKRNIITKPDRIRLFVRSLPYTSVIMSLIVKIIGKTKIATLA